MNYLIANWKASMTKEHLITWMETFFKRYDEEKLDIPLKEKGIVIILCPPYPLIPLLKQQAKPYASVAIGAQHVSPVKQGAYTGEVTAEVLKDYVSYALIGHSERRQHFHLTEEDIAKQIQNCNSNTITPILCVRNEQDKLYGGVKMVAFEPPSSIGNGHNAEVNDVLAMKKNLRLQSETSFMYGASVDIKNIASYLETGEINGLLVGTASLDPQTFFQMIKVMMSA
jgi:triosephosphate isomerase